jgi:protein-S-isoprenylcysteine O-methyltransferase Ste14
VVDILSGIEDKSNRQLSSFLGNGKMKTVKFKGYLIVAIQVICLVFIFISGSLFADHPVLLILEVAGFILGIWAVAIMDVCNLNIAPYIKKDAHLVTDGPYRLIRHPMYAAALLIIWPLIIDQFSLWRLIAALILTVDLLTKMLFEEALLKEHFAEYQSYMKKTKRLIPFVF